MGTGGDVVDATDDIADVGAAARRSATAAVSWFAMGVFAAANVYYFHRWFFRYSSSSTSPTYEDTPVSWKVGKYVLMALAVTIAATVAWRRSAIDRSSLRLLSDGPWRWMVAFVVYVGALSLVGVAIDDDAAGLVSWYFFVPAVLLWALSQPGRGSLVVIARVGVGLIVYHACFVVMQIVAYVAFDRVPALSYRNGLLRFGGGLDDPNGFGVLAVLPLLLVIATLRSFQRRWLAGVLVAVTAAMVAVPASFTALVAAVVGLAALAPIRRQCRILVAVAAGASAIGALLMAIPYIRTTVERKSQSARRRFDLDGSSIDNGIGEYVSDASWFEFIVGSPGSDVSTENSYVAAFTEFGLIGVIIVVGAVVVSVRGGAASAHAARNAGDVHLARVLEGTTAFLVAFAVAALGVPFFEVFPTNMAFWGAAAVCFVAPSWIRQRADGEDRRVGVDVDASLAGDAE